MHITLSLGSIIASDAIIKAFIPAEVTIILEGDTYFLCKAEVYLDIVLTALVIARMTILIRNIIDKLKERSE